MLQIKLRNNRWCDAAIFSGYGGPECLSGKISNNFHENPLILAKMLFSKTAHPMLFANYDCQFGELPNYDQQVASEIQKMKYYLSTDRQVPMKALLEKTL